MNLRFYKPKNKLLHPYMEGYYFLSKKESEPSFEYLTFPNNFSIISVYQDTELTFSENKVVINGKKNGAFSSDLICHYKKPIQVVCKGELNEITFYFKPLGLNAFLDKPLSNFTNDFFCNFIPFEDYVAVMQSILEEKNFEKQKDNIENYWISKLVGFKHPFLNQIIDDLTNVNNDYSIAELAEKHKTSRQNLSKHFEMHLCKTPSDFKKIHRFREALKTKIDKKKSDENLTALSNDLLFYDQSHLIKDFKSLTGMTPKAFFKNISPQENGEINWLYTQ